MTVSSRWPQEGRQLPTDSGRPIANAIGDGSSDAPPTLFELPNLNPQPERACGHQSETQHGKPRDPRSHPQTGPSTLGIPVEPQGAVPPEPGDRKSQQTVNAPPDAAGNRSAPTIDLDSGCRDHDIPAGRGWMDALQQHGVVVMLLLLVVATALLTGRDHGFEQVEVPIVDTEPVQSSATTPVAEAPVPAQTPGRQSEVAAAVDSEPVSVPPASVSRPEAPEALSGAADPSARSGIALNEPHSSAAAPGPTAEPAIAAPEQVLTPSAQTIANRTSRYSSTNQPGEIKSPSLETLLEKVESSEHSPAPRSHGNAESIATVPVFSRTPAGISDWTRYLPPLQPDVSNP